jgi:SAM-dependent methyltransferase
MTLRNLYETNEEMFQAFRDDRMEAIALAAAHYGVLPETVLETVRHLEVNCRDHPRAAASFDSELGAFRRAFLVLEDLEVRGGIRLARANVLDIGCGGGHAMRAAWERGAANVIGLEIDGRRALAANDSLARYGKPPTIATGSVLDPGVVARLGRDFDFIFLFDLLEHVPSVDDLLGTVRSLLKPGGTTVIRIGNPYNPELLLREPHYGLPGMTLLDREAALEYFRSQATGEYEVYDWLCRSEVEALLRSIGFEVQPIPQERTHPISEFDRVSEQLLNSTTYPTPAIAAQVRRELRLLRILRDHLADPGDFFGPMIHTIMGKTVAAHQGPSEVTSR